jgi:hypothetical protein
LKLKCGGNGTRWWSAVGGYLRYIGLRKGVSVFARSLFSGSRWTESCYIRESISCRGFHCAMIALRTAQGCRDSAARHQTFPIKRVVLHRFHPPPSLHSAFAVPAALPSHPFTHYFINCPPKLITNTVVRHVRLTFPRSCLVVQQPIRHPCLLLPHVRGSYTSTRKVYRRLCDWGWRVKKNPPSSSLTPRRSRLPSETFLRCMLQHRDM